MTHKRFSSTATRRKGNKKGVEVMRATAPGAVRAVSPRKFPTIKAANEAAKRASRISGVKGGGGVRGRKSGRKQ